MTKDWSSISQLNIRKIESLHIYRSLDEGNSSSFNPQKLWTKAHVQCIDQWKFQMISEKVWMIRHTQISQND